MITFRHFVRLNEAHVTKKLPDGWVVQVQPHFEERYSQRKGNVDLNKFYAMIEKIVSKWDGEQKKDWENYEVGFVYAKTNTRAIFNVNVPKKQLRTITYLDPNMILKQGTKGVRLHENYSDVEFFEVGEL